MPGSYFDLIYLGPPPLAWFPPGCLRLISSHMRLSRGRVASLSQTLDDTGAPELLVTWTSRAHRRSVIITVSFPNLPSLYLTASYVAPRTPFHRTGRFFCFLSPSWFLVRSAIINKHHCDREALASRRSLTRCKHGESPCFSLSVSTRYCMQAWEGDFRFKLRKWLAYLDHPPSL